MLCQSIMCHQPSVDVDVFGTPVAGRSSSSSSLFSFIKNVTADRSELLGKQCTQISVTALVTVRPFCQDISPAYIGYSVHEIERNHYTTRRLAIANRSRVSIRGGPCKKFSSYPVASIHRRVWRSEPESRRISRTWMLKDDGLRSYSF